MVNLETQITLGIVIMAHPSRRARAELLAEWVHADVIIWDHRQQGEWDTGRRAWRAGVELGTSHILVLQDDAEPISNLRATVIDALGTFPNNPISLYLGQKKPSKWAEIIQNVTAAADAYQANWIAATHLLHGVAIVLRSEWISPMLQWAEMSSQPYDQRIGAYFRRERNLTTFYTWPSLVDHADIPSLVKHADDKRLSADGRIAYRVGVPESFSRIIVMARTPETAEI